MDFKLSAVIVTIPKHLHFLSELVNNINEMHPNFYEVVIVASGCRAYKSYIIDKVKEFKSKKVILIFNELSPSGKNRNLGWKFSTGDILSFLDGDDLYHVNRNKKILNIFDKNTIDVFLHSYSTYFPIVPLNKKNKKLEIENEHLANFTKYNRIFELLGLTKSTNLVFKNQQVEFPIAHGHITLINDGSISTRFHQFKRLRNEDGIFLRDVLRQQKKILISNEPLSYYRKLENIIYSIDLKAARSYENLDPSKIQEEVIEIK